MLPVQGGLEHLHVRPAWHVHRTQLPRFNELPRTGHCTQSKTLIPRNRRSWRSSREFLPQKERGSQGMLRQFLESHRNRRAPDYSHRRVKSLPENPTSATAWVNSKEYHSFWTRKVLVPKFKKLSQSTASIQTD